MLFSTSFDFSISVRFINICELAQPMTKELNCNSCNVRITNLTGSVKFKCPKCGESDLVRCVHCRKIVAKYTCPSCNFTGPN